MVSAVFHSPLDAAAGASPHRCMPQERSAARAAAAARCGRRATRAAARAAARLQLHLAARAAADPGLRAAGADLGAGGAQEHQRLSLAAGNLEAGARRVQRPVLQQGPERPGRRLERAVVAAARGAGLRPGGGGRHPGRLRDRALRVPVAHVQSADQPAAAGVAAGLAADRPAGVQGRQPGRHLDHLHLLDLADDHQHRGGRAARAAATT